MVDSPVPPAIRDAQVARAEERVPSAAKLLVERVEGDQIVAGAEDGIGAEVWA